MSILKNAITGLSLSFNHMTESVVEYELINILYQHKKEDLVPLILNLQRREIDQLKKKINKGYYAVEDSLHISAELGQLILENKKSKAKKTALMIFEENKCFPYLIRTASYYFWAGCFEGASILGKWWFNKFLNILVKNRVTYEKGGDDRGWLIEYGHADYVDKVLSIYDKGEKG